MKRSTSVFIMAMLVASLFPFAAKASPLRGNPIFQETYARCLSTTGTSGRLSSRVQIIWESFSFRTVRESAIQGFQVLVIDPNAIATVIQTRGLTPRVAQALQSAEFHRALGECYGDDDSLKQTYIAGMVAADVTGKVAAAAIAVGAGLLTARLIGLAVTAYPALRYVVVGAYVASTLATARTIYLTVRDSLRDATPEERAQGEAIVAQPVRAVAGHLDAAIRLLERQIAFRIELMNMATSEESNLLTQRVVELMNHLERLKLLSNQQSRG